MRFSHAMVVGGTGMLRDASGFVAGCSAVATLIARTRRSLDALDRALDGTPPVHDTVAADWSDDEGFGAAVAAAVETHGVPDLVLAWLHDDDAAIRLARDLASVREPFRYVRLLGSAAASPDASLEEDRRAFESLPGLTYQQVVLGFEIDESGSRWLTDAEISDGACRAVRESSPLLVVGRVEPWSARP